MTSAQIDKLSLDELRIAVAEERGWKFKIRTEGDMVYVLGPGDKDDDGAFHVNPLHPDRMNVLGIPDYPRDWDAAGELLEDWFASKGRYELIDMGIDHRCSLFPADKSDVWRGFGKTIPESVSRAWLKSRKGKTT
jgi:hypothetical protein